MFTAENKKPTSSRPEDRASRLDSIRLYRLSELEPVLGVKSRTIQSYIKAGSLKGVKIGGSWRVSETELRRFINGEG